MSVLTDILVLHTLINVLQNDSHTIRPVSRPARTQLIVFLRANPRTFLAIVAPGSADAAATRCLRHRRRYFKDALRLSGAMFVAREAKRLASINAGIPGFHELVMRWASADVFALCIDASTILAGLRALALVHVGAVAAGIVQFVALVAFAAEHAKDVFAAAVDAQIVKHIAFVNINARLLATLVRMHEAHFALASIRARIIQAVSVFAKRTVLRALVDVLAGVTITAKTGVAHALEGAFGVDAVRVGVAAAVVGRAFVDIPALDPVPGETIMTRAYVRTLGVLTLGELAARVGVQSTFVVVGARWSFRWLHRVTFLATAVEGADRVVAFAESAYLRLHHALVDIYTGYAVSSGQQTVRAIACVATRYILAFTSVADSRIILAFVHVHASTSVQV